MTVKYISLFINKSRLQHNAAFCSNNWVALDLPKSKNGGNGKNIGSIILKRKIKT